MSLSSRGRLVLRVRGAHLGAAGVGGGQSSRAVVESHGGRGLEGSVNQCLAGGISYLTL